VTCSGHHNVLNPFTPFGDCSLVRWQNLYPISRRLHGTRNWQACFDMVTRNRQLMNLRDYGIAIGNPADLICRCHDAAWDRGAVQTASRIHAGRRSFARLPRPHPRINPEST